MRRGWPPLTLLYRHEASRGHDTGSHPENERRLVALDQGLAAADPRLFEPREPPAATHEQLARVHDPGHLRELESFCAAGGGMIDMDTVAAPGSWEAALRGAGGACDAVERLLAGERRAAFCAMRPPGHHAERARAMGFCLVNNVAVAAAHAIAACGAERVLVLDWDVHHGNGTEAIFRASDDVLYASIHQWPLYPGTGAADYAGEGDGEGYTVNLPVPPGSDGALFRALVEHLVVPLALRYEPSLVAISAGYDAHRDDPLASCAVATEDYGTMAAAMAAVAAELEAPVLACLEGGYAPQALAASVVATLAGLAHPSAEPTTDPGLAAAHRDRLPRRWAA